MSQEVSDDRVSKARRLTEEARAAERRGQCDDAVECFNEAIRLLESTPDQQLLADALRWKGTTLRERGETQAAAEIYQRSVEVARAANAKNSEAHSLNCLAIVAQRRGDFQSAEVLYDLATTLAARVGDHQLLGMIGQNRGVMAQVRGQRDIALARYEEALTAFEAARNGEAVTWTLNNLGMLHAECGEFAKAERMYERGLALAIDHGDQRMEGLVEINRAQLRLRQDRLDDAEACCSQAYRIAAARGDFLNAAEALKCRASLERQRGDCDGAHATLQLARSLAEECEDALLSAEIQRELGKVCEARGETELAMEAWRRAHTGFLNLGATVDARDISARLDSLH